MRRRGSHPRRACGAEPILVLHVRGERREARDEVSRQPLTKALHERRLLFRSRLIGEQLEAKPANGIGLRAGMQEQVLRDALQPLRADRAASRIAVPATTYVHSVFAFRNHDITRGYGPGGRLPKV